MLVPSTNVSKRCRQNGTQCLHCLPDLSVVIQSSRVITIIFTTETSTSDGISLGTDLFLSKFIIFYLNSHYPTPTVIPGDEMHFCTHFYSFKQQKKTSDNFFIAKIFNLP